MNNLVFNNHAQELKTSIFGIDSTNQQQQIKVDDTTGALLIQTASTDPLQVTVANQDAIAISGNVGLAGTPTVQIDGTTPVEVTLTGNSTVVIDDTNPVGVTITNSFVENTQATTEITAGTSTVILANQDISQLKEGTFFLYNADGGSTVTITLQIRPSEAAAYITDKAVSPVLVEAGQGVAIHLSTFAKQAQLSCSVATGTASVTGYFNGQR